MTQRPLVLVAGSVASNFRNGGIAWERLSWILGLERLGLDVLVLDQLDRGRLVHPADGPRDYEHCLNRAWFDETMGRFGLLDRAVLLTEDGDVLHGPPYGELAERVEAAELLVNVAGNLRVDDLKRRCRLRVFVDVDPGFTQLWMASGRGVPRAGGHDVYATIGENVGTPASALPDAGVRWLHTRQPVLLDEWRSVAAPDPHRLTSIARWRGSGPHGRLDDIGHDFTEKADELRRVAELPRHTSQTFELALDVAPRDAEAVPWLEGHGWRVIDPRSVAGDADAFRAYVEGSGGEFSVAKGVYAATNSGWFSDRTTRYLAAGKPALVQDTGFARSIPTGEGLVAFASLDEAVDGARRIARDYEAHCRAARALAEEHFGSDAVLSRFLADVRAAA